MQKHGEVASVNKSTPAVLTLFWALYAVVIGGELAFSGIYFIYSFKNELHK
jgi:hypothetical protein